MVGGRKMSGGLSPLNLYSPQSMTTGFFNENHLRNWANTRKSMVTQRYERELEIRVAAGNDAKKWEKTAKRQQKHVKDSVQGEVRKLETERLERIADDRRKEEMRGYFESKN